MVPEFVRFVWSRGARAPACRLAHSTGSAGFGVPAALALLGVALGGWDIAWDRPVAVLLVTALPACALLLAAGVVVVRRMRRLRHALRVLSDAVENISQGLILIDEQDRVPLINARAIELLSITPEILAENPTFTRLVQWQMDRDDVTWDARTGVRLPGTEGAEDRYERVRPNGAVLEVQTKRLPSGGHVRTFSDITDRRQDERRIRHMAHHDGLTGLANRTLLADRLSQAVSQARRPKGGGGHEGFAVLALDLDRFKAINDSFGHAAGDELLRQVGERLAGTLRSGDTLARVGGDEFVIIQTGVHQPTSTADLAARLVTLLTAPFHLGANRVQVGVSLGIVLSDAADRDEGGGDVGGDVDQLLKNADTALYRAKTAGRGGFCFFEPEMDRQLQARRALEADLRQAIGTDQLCLHFQPIVKADTREITGYEALLRWKHPVHGMVPPARFIPIAEESGLIVGIGTWVLEEACGQAMRWPVRRRVAVNLSAVQLRSGDLPDLVAGILRRTGLPPQLLELEITESLLIENPEKVLESLVALRAMGVRIACDDFGTGYSSFSYLQNLAFDRLKIDMSFTHALGTKPAALRIVQAILAMATSLGMDVTAEGVETEAQLAILHGEGCGELQGYLLGRPAAGDAGPQPTPPAHAARLSPKRLAPHV